MYGAVGGNSIDFPRILYRLFPDNSEQTPGRYGSNDLIVWENRSVPIVPPLGWHGSNEMFVWDKRSVPIAELLG